MEENKNDFNNGLEYRFPRYYGTDFERDQNQRNYLNPPNDYFVREREFDEKKQKYIRITVVLMFLSLLTMITLTQSFLVADNISCIEDKLFNWTEGVNKYFQDNSGPKHVFMITCGLMMDIMVLTQFYRFAFFGSTWRFIIALSMFYTFRFLCQQVFLFRYPDGYLWDFPGFYSITVPYGRTNDFFFSGHIGCCMICFCEYKSHGWTRFAWFSLATMISQLMLMISLRGHYIIDLIAGVIFAHYFWLLSERYSYMIDVKIFKIPFKKRFPMFVTSCIKCQHPLSIWSDPSSEDHYAGSEDKEKYNINQD